MLENTLINDDSLNVMNKIDDNQIDVIYLDPPFYTQDIQKLVSRESEEEYSFSDKWSCMDEYLEYMAQTLSEGKDLPKNIIDEYKPYYKGTAKPWLEGFSGFIKEFKRFINT